jgi:hypothetical protein
LPATNRELSRLARKLSNSFEIISGNYPQSQPLTDSEGKWRKWEIKMNAQRSTLKAIGKVNLETMRTAAYSKLHLVSELDLDVHLRLQILQNHFRITN